MNPKIIVIDGKAYHSVDEMPPDIRQRYELAVRLLSDADQAEVSDAFGPRDVSADRNRNGVPDMLENIVAANAVVDGMKIIIDGQEFNGIENLPPEARARYEEAMRKLDANRNGVPDFVERMLKPTNQTANISTGFETETARHSTPLPVSPTITPDTSNGWMLGIAVLFILLLCVSAAAGVWYFFLR
ncbi:MAG: hypothetical protein WCC12_22150 [Anaerolineales bacterium]